MKYDARNLKINSIVLIILSILDFIIMAGELMVEKIDIDTIMADANTTEQIATIVFAAVIGVSVLTYLVTLYIGVKGLRQANGKCKGGANITWAKIMLVLNIIGFAGSIYDIIRGQMDIHYLCQELIYISIFYPYIKSAKNV